MQTVLRDAEVENASGQAELDALFADLVGAVPALHVRRAAVQMRINPKITNVYEKRPIAAAPSAMKAARMTSAAPIPNNRNPAGAAAAPRSAT